MIRTRKKKNAFNDATNLDQLGPAFDRITPNVSAPATEAQIKAAELKTCGAQFRGRRQQAWGTGKKVQATALSYQWRRRTNRRRPIDHTARLFPPQSEDDIR